VVGEPATEAKRVPNPVTSGHPLPRAQMNIPAASRSLYLNGEPMRSISELLSSLQSRVARSLGPPGFSVRAFRRREQFRPNYDELCAALLLTLEGQVSNVLDVGSGNGFLIDAFVRHGVDVRGVEMATAVRPFLSEEALGRTTFADATTIGKLGHFDLVTCVEVAEHVPSERSEALMDVVAENAAKWLYFTAATPFQPGRGHINARPHFFWLRGFRNRGLHLDYERTAYLISLIAEMEPCRWLPLNSLILHRVAL
jgi:SAM-dependent methyltransferase